MCAPPFATKQRPPIWKILDPPLLLQFFFESSTYTGNNYRLQQSCGKAIFSQASVSHSVHRVGEGDVWQTPLDRHPLGRHPPEQTPSGRHPHADTQHAQCMLGHTHTPYPVHAGIHPPPACSGRYASYWNAFLFSIYL